MMQSDKSKQVIAINILFDIRASKTVDTTGSSQTLDTTAGEKLLPEENNKMPAKNRCDWVGIGKPHYENYHDTEWGVPVHDDRKHFEMLILEGAQAGLNWETILKRREGYFKAFKKFDPVAVAKMTDDELEALRLNPEIIRNKLKIYSARKNAQVFLAIQKQFGSFDKYVWEFVNGQPKINRPQTLKQVPPTSEESDALSIDLKKRGMSFVGSTIIYAYLQATGLINDHLVTCFRAEIQ